MSQRTGLRTDHYELSMLSAALRRGTSERDCVFEVFCRRLPAGRRYGVMAGLGRVLDAVDRFGFDEADLAYLREHDVISAESADFLSSYRFRGSIAAYPEGELFFPESPILSVRGTFADAVVLETVVLSILNHDCAIAAAAARMVSAQSSGAGPKPSSRSAETGSVVAAIRMRALSSDSARVTA